MFASEMVSALVGVKAGVVVKVMCMGMLCIVHEVKTKNP